MVTPPEGATRLADGRYSIPASSVRLPNRLVISGVEFVPSVLRSRNPYTGRFRVTDTRGYVVRDAIVLVTGVPLGWIQAPRRSPQESSAEPAQARSRSSIVSLHISSTTRSASMTRMAT